MVLRATPTKPGAREALPAKNDPRPRSMVMDKCPRCGQTKVLEAPDLASLNVLQKAWWRTHADKRHGGENGAWEGTEGEDNDDYGR